MDTNSCSIFMLCPLLSNFYSLFNPIIQHWIMVNKVSCKSVSNNLRCVWLQTLKFTGFPFKILPIIMLFRHIYFHLSATDKHLLWNVVCCFRPDVRRLTAQPAVVLHIWLTACCKHVAANLLSTVWELASRGKQHTVTIWAAYMIRSEILRKRHWSFFIIRLPVP